MATIVVKKSQGRELARVEPSLGARNIQAVVDDGNPAPVAKCNLQVTSQNGAIELAPMDPSQREEEVQRITDAGEPVTMATFKLHRWQRVTRG